MRLPRVRITVWWLMIAVAVILVFERLLFRFAALQVASGAEYSYLWHEAITVWLILNAVLVFYSLLFLLCHPHD
jgi:hypothetical protein